MGKDCPFCTQDDPRGKRQLFHSLSSETAPPSACIKTGASDTGLAGQGHNG